MRDLYKALDINRILVLEKITKYDLEILNGLSPDEIRQRFPLAYKTHYTHKKIMQTLLNQLQYKYKIHANVLRAQSRGLTIIDCENSAFPPDIIISAGGDGTFLEAASLIPPLKTRNNKPLWVIGINTDPERSMGALCVSYFERENWFKHPNDDTKLEDACPSVKLSSRFPGNAYSLPKPNKIRFIDDDLCTRTNTCENGKREIADITSASFNSNGVAVPMNVQNALVGTNISSLYDITYEDYVGTLLQRLLVQRDFDPIVRQRIRLKLFKQCCKIENIPYDSSTLENQLFKETGSKFDTDDLNQTETMAEGLSVPYGAINDVMIADQSFGKTFYALVQIDDNPIMRVKSSGVLITTGLLEL
ncbi:bifunctional Inorganic polyphosphate-ATP-NAD kinase [Babesia duncani]|uniref:Bifunctional Inorganic polyphosphate-ATP-NAD kinase n=1 Tax=Babesia duncani TaxID=323732 RepID=A0AAD9PN80_9APIC|nr:bifunctional Inorganic polyphosphate-ATP-NAD kinase [Babesia duncani]